MYPQSFCFQNNEDGSERLCDLQIQLFMFAFSYMCVCVMLNI